MLYHEKFYGTIDGYDDNKNKFIIKFDTGTNYHGDGLVGIEELAEVPVAPALGSHPQLSSHATSSASVSNVHPSPISGYASLLEQGQQYMASFAPSPDEHEPFQVDASSELQAPAPSNYAAPSVSFQPQFDMGYYAAASAAASFQSQFDINQPINQSGMGRINTLPSHQAVVHHEAAARMQRSACRMGYAPGLSNGEQEEKEEEDDGSYKEESDDMVSMGKFVYT